ncbi:MAG: hypothetical protein M0P91_04510 [Sulfuricurvum sp.]|jgi:hypothetical protein|uniref:hypothetical protein n=1 Tax=Sulfuricurvum sp. TaxID=2025608 RepID=UPI0025D278CA|nr:hypothetical protein [Sulfuricurvum sp.]MCK9372437.1 hypothetical protein [Sulfuricurvum sp.]
MRVIDIINQFKASKSSICFHQLKINGHKTEIEILKLAALVKEVNISSSFIKILKTETDNSKNYLSLSKIKKYKNFLRNSYPNSESFLDKAIELYQINLDDKKLKALKILLTKNKREQEILLTKNEREPIENDTTKISSDSKYTFIDEEDFSDENFYEFE